MSAHSVASLDALRAQAMVSTRSEAYRDALGKAPAPVVVAHLVLTAGRLLGMAARVAIGRRR